jgi:A/G-specific adenine glycosylase
LRYLKVVTVTEKLVNWYRTAHRKLPWRGIADPYRIWISEVMLQQTRVAAVIPYYERFLNRFPDLRSLADAPEQDLLAAWAGLGYYSRARNLQRAARHMNGEFPRDYQGIRDLPGVGDYTAAAVASIAFGLPYAVLDGNVLRVLSRVTNEDGDIGSPAVRRRLQGTADQLLDAESPGVFNQALMELGATVCLPKQPQCMVCPIAEDCEARRHGCQSQLPVKLRRTDIVKWDRTLLVILRDGAYLMWQRPAESVKMANFWELPDKDQLPGAQLGETVGVFNHSITNNDYRVEVVQAGVPKEPEGFRWIRPDEMGSVPMSTTARKAIAIFSSRL